MKRLWKVGDFVYVEPYKQVPAKKPNKLGFYFPPDGGPAQWKWVPATPFYGIVTDVQGDSIGCMFLKRRVRGWTYNGWQAWYTPGDKWSKCKATLKNNEMPEYIRNRWIVFWLNKCR
jgi:hypothetical protein